MVSHPSLLYSSQLRLAFPGVFNAIPGPGHSSQAGQGDLLIRRFTNTIRLALNSLEGGFNLSQQQLPVLKQVNREFLLPGIACPFSQMDWGERRFTTTVWPTSVHGLVVEAGCIAHELTPLLEKRLANFFQLLKSPAPLTLISSLVRLGRLCFVLQSLH